MNWKTYYVYENGKRQLGAWTARSDFSAILDCYDSQRSEMSDDELVDKYDRKEIWAKEITEDDE